MVARARFDVTGRTCLVTGAGRGIGRATTEAFANAGARVIVADVDEASAKSVADGITATGGLACAIGLDVGSAISVETGIAQAARFGSVVRVNLTGVFLCSQAAARVMRAQGGGRIMSVASIYGLVGPALHAASPYAATKSGVVGLTRALAIEWAAEGIRVNAVAPTHVRTEMTRARVDDEEYRARLLARTPLGRVLEPDDVVGALLFLASPAADSITGHVLAVDGGWLAE